MVKKQDLENKADSNEAERKELELLRARVATLEAEKRVAPVVHPFTEIQQMRQRGQDDSGSIKYKDVNDHRNIRLWHTNGREVGRSIGPIHPANAESAYMDFASKGIILSVRRPTSEQIERYKQTDEYKSLAKAEERRRESKKSMSKENSIDKLTQAVAKMAGIPLDQVNSIKPNALVSR